MLTPRSFEHVVCSVCRCSGMLRQFCNLRWDTFITSNHRCAVFRCAVFRSWIFHLSLSCSISPLEESLQARITRFPRFKRDSKTDLKIHNKTPEQTWKFTIRIQNRPATKRTVDMEFNCWNENTSEKEINGQNTLGPIRAPRLNWDSYFMKRGASAYMQVYKG